MSEQWIKDAAEELWEGVTSQAYIEEVIRKHLYGHFGASPTAGLVDRMERVEQLEGLLRECQKQMRHPKSCECPCSCGLPELLARIDAALVADKGGT